MKPRTPPHPVRAVHVTADAWADPGLRKGVLDLIAQGRINAVELDLKQEGGIDRLERPGAARARDRRRLRPLRPARPRSQLLHSKGVRVIGRLVCFNDPIYAAYAWKHGRRDQVVQTPGGQQYGGYGGFTNFADPVVRKYQIDVAVAGSQGRRRRGPLRLRPQARRADLVDGLPRAEGARPKTAIVSFLAETRTALKPYGTYLGASVFGIAATRPDRGRPEHPRDGRAPRLRLGDGLPVALGAGRVRRRRPERAAVRHRPALARGLPEGRPRHGCPRRPVAPGLHARQPHVWAGAGERPDPRRARRRHRRVPALGSARHVHRGRASDRRAHCGVPEAPRRRRSSPSR